MSDAPSRFTPAAIRPTDEQRAIQRSSEKTLLVQANAGAAKTTTLALRVGEAIASGVPPERILVLTYTAPACEAMARALEKVGVTERVPIRTFEQFSEKVLLGVERQGVPRRLTPEALAPTVREAVGRLDLGVDDGIVERFLDAARRLKGTLARDLRLWEGEALTDDIAEELGIEPVLLRLFGAYETLRYPDADGCDRPRFRGDSDATYDLARLLADPETRTPLHEVPTWPRDIDELLVDEMHDLNLAMFTVLRALLQTRPSLRFCGVGDVDQVVHGTAGAEQRFMRADVDLGPGRRVAVLSLTATRRFSATLSTLAGRLAEKKYASEADHKTGVNLQWSDGAEAAAAVVVAEALAWKRLHPNDMTGFAVLLRHPHQSVLLENALIRADLPYHTLGFESYVMQPEVLLVRTLLAVAGNDFDALESEATRREIVRALVFFCDVALDYRDSEGETPQQRLDEAVAAVAADKALLKSFFEFQVLRRGDPVRVRRVRDALQACQAGGPDVLGRVLDALDVEALVHSVFIERQRRADALAYMAGLRHAARSFSTAVQFFHGLNQAENRLKAVASQRTTRQKATVLKKKSITLATVPAVKGLEFDHVVMPFLAQGEFPARLADSAIQERNLFYVGITRAREALTLVGERRRPSEFIAKMGLESPPALQDVLPAEIPCTPRP